MRRLLIRPSTLAVAAACAGLAAIVTLPQPAAACGGFFCNNLAPVVQSGESILFHVQDGMVEAHVQVLYEGPSESFAWIVPTPSRPEVGVSHARLFSALQPALRQRPEFDVTVEGTCYQPPYCPSDDWDEGDWQDSAPDAAFADSGAVGEPGVVVVEVGNTGPYDYVVLQAESTAPLFEWLNANDYDIPAVIEPFVEPYVLMEDDVHFVAFRLSKNRDTGDIVPVVLRYASLEPMIPIQLTAVASASALPVHVYLLGDSRAVPENYVHIVPNPAAGQPAWAGMGGDMAIAAAVQEAGGQAFMTHYAGTTGLLSSRVFAEWLRVPALSEGDSVDNVINSVAQWLVNSGLGLDSTVLAALERHITLSERAVAAGATLTQIMNCPFCFDLSGSTVDTASLYAELVEAVEEPLEHAQGLIDGSEVITYLATVLEPEDMTRDPYFTFNADLPEVSNAVRGTHVQVCGRGRAPWLAPWRTEYADGPTIWGAQAGTAVPGVSAVLRVEELGSAGPAMLVTDNAAETARLVEEWNAGVRARLDIDPTEPPGPVTCDDDPEDWTDAGTPDAALSDAGGTDGDAGTSLPERPNYPSAPGTWRFDDVSGQWVRTDEPQEAKACTAATPGALALWMAAPLVVSLRRRRRA
jgi:hypothetical protein